MFKVSQLISLPVINIFKLKIEGYIEQACFNTARKKLEVLKIYDESSNIYKALKISDIYKITNTAVFITNSSKITLYDNLELELSTLQSPINTKIITLEGADSNTVKDVEVYKNGQISKLITTNKEFNSNLIIGFSDELTLISDKKICLSKFKPQTKRILPPPIDKNISDPVVTILDFKPEQKTQTNYNFLLNRKILKDIKNQSGEIIARENTIVSQNTLAKLKYYGKLKELTLNSK